MMETPDRKVGAAGLGGAVSVVLVWLVGITTGVDVPAVVGAAIGTICSFAAGYFVRQP